MLNVTTDEKGRIRMTKEWTEKLWIDFERDRELDSGIIADEEDDSVYHEVVSLRLDNHIATEDYIK